MACKTINRPCFCTTAVRTEELFPEYIDGRNVNISRYNRAELKAFRLIHVGNVA